MKNNKQQSVLSPFFSGHIRIFLCFSVVCVFALIAQQSRAQVNVVGSKEERATDAKALTEKTSEKPATPADRALLEAQLQALIDAYERGDVGFFQAKIDPSMPGYSRVLDSMRRDATSQTRSRLLFTDQTWSIGPNVAMLQARFQKRYFDARNLNPELIEGRVVMLLSRDGDLWRISAVTGDNPFESKSLAPCGTGLIRLVSPANANTEPLFVEVEDADLAGVPTIQIDILTDRGDREFVTLPALTPAGLFRAQVNVRRLTQQGVAVPGNSLVDLIGDAVVTARYADQCIAVTRTQQIVTASDTRRDPGVLGQLACRVGGNATFVSLASASANSPTNAPITLELNDPDLAGLPSIDVLIRTSGGDNELLTLGAISNLGRFANTSVPTRAGTGVAVAVRNGVLELSGPSALSAEYLDQRPGAVGRTQVINADCGSIASGYQAAQLACSLNLTLNDLTPDQPRSTPIQVSVVDPDLALANPTSINATLSNSQGDRETIRLDAQGSGRYGASSYSMMLRTSSPGNNVLEFSQPSTVRVEYTDSTTGSGSPQALSQTCGNVSQGFTLATLEITFPAGLGRAVPSLSLGNNAVAGACLIVLRDPDRTSPSATVSLVATNTQTGKVDTETLTLTQASPGVYQRASCQYEGFIYSPASTTQLSNPVPGNGIINLGGGTSTINVSHIDNTVPGGGSQVVSRSTSITN